MKFPTSSHCNLLALSAWGLVVAVMSPTTMVSASSFRGARHSNSPKGHTSRQAQEDGVAYVYGSLAETTNTSTTSNSNSCRWSFQCPQPNCLFDSSNCPQTTCVNGQCIIDIGIGVNSPEYDDTGNSFGNNGQCGTVICSEQEFCCNKGCSLCRQKGQDCPEALMICDVAQDPDQVEVTTPCGTAECPPGTYCCNESCGICRVNGVECQDELKICQSDEEQDDEEVEGEEEDEDEDDEEAEREDEEDEQGEAVQQLVSCGSNECAADEICCNPSCGTCAQPGEACNKMLCNQEDEVEEKKEPSGLLDISRDDECVCSDKCRFCVSRNSLCVQLFCGF